MMIDVIQRAKIKLIENNVSPPYLICLSLSAHDLLVDEINKGDRRKNTRIFEIGDMKVEIDPLCRWPLFHSGYTSKSGEETWFHCARTKKPIRHINKCDLQGNTKTQREAFLEFKSHA
jgi:hypothetical protein